MSLMSDQIWLNIELINWKKGQKKNIQAKVQKKETEDSKKPYMGQ